MVLRNQVCLALLYIAYRDNTDSSYDGVLIYGNHYDFNNGVITMGKDSVCVDVSRVSSSYNAVTSYDRYSADGLSVDLSYTGSVVYYSNLDGYPVLGGYSAPVGYSPFIIAALICSLLSVVLTSILKR